jgi:phosphoglucosamine mutase
MARLFGTDGVRGLANKEVTAELALKLGQAAAAYFSRAGEKKPKIFIGRDTRLSGEMLAAALAAGICSAGGEAHLLGVMPTPAVAYLTANSDACAGAVISASHNPFYDNGIKFFAASGYKLPDDAEDDLQKLAEEKSLLLPVGEGVGGVFTRFGLAEEYVSHIKNTAGMDFYGLKIVLDCANGASYEVAPQVLRSLGAEVIVINDRPDGLNINDRCGSTHMEGLREEVLARGAQAGVAHDGDADRCLMVDELGRVVDGDQLMLICALELRPAGRLPGSALVTTVMSNIGLEAALKKHGVNCLRTQVGDRYVLEAMLEKGCGLGGEQSGHIIFRDYATTGDGLLTAVQVLRAMARNNRPLSELADLMTKYPQILQNVRVAPKDGWQDNRLIKDAILYAQKQLGDAGRVLVRASGTEPLIRVMLEGPEQRVLEELSGFLVNVIQKELS